MKMIMLISEVMMKTVVLVWGKRWTVAADRLSMLEMV